jgi:hypothetical protein
MKFFMAMLAAFLARVNPDSTRVNPACMKKTRIPDKRIHNIVKSSFASTATADVMMFGIVVNNDIS